MAIPALQNAVLGVVAPAQIGKASGTFNAMRQLGGVFGIAILAASFSASGSYASPQSFSGGFTAAVGLAAGLSLAGALAGAFLPSRRAANKARAASASPARAAAQA